MGADGTMEKGTPKDGRRMIGGKGNEHERRDREGTEGAGNIEVIGAGKGMGRGDATYLPIYLSTYLPTYQPTYLPTCLPAYLPTGNKPDKDGLQK